MHSIHTSGSEEHCLQPGTLQSIHSLLIKLNKFEHYKHILGLSGQNTHSFITQFKVH